MENSKQYAADLKAMLKAVRAGGAKAKKPSWDDPIDALLFATVSEYMPDAAARAVIKKLHGHFVDLNDLRVARPEEIIELMEMDWLQGRPVAEAITAALNAIFGEFDVVSLAELAEHGKKTAKDKLGRLNGISRFACDYVLLTTQGIHAVPINSMMLKYMRDNDYVSPKASDADALDFIEKNVPAAAAYEFYCGLKKAAESGKPLIVKTPAAASKQSGRETKKKTPKKTDE